VSIEIFVWLVLLLSTLLISRIAFSINLGTADTASRVATETVRVIVSGLIIVIWLLIWKRVTHIYFWRAIATRRATT